MTLDKIQYAALGIITGSMGLYDEHPIIRDSRNALQFRRKWLTTKFLMGRMTTENPIYKIIKELQKDYEKFNNYQKNKNTPYALDALKKIKKLYLKRKHIKIIKGQILGYVKKKTLIMRLDYHII